MCLLITAVIAAIILFLGYLGLGAELRTNYHIYKRALIVWQTFSWDDIKKLAKDAHASATSLRSLYEGGYNVIFYPIAGVIEGIVGAICVSLERVKTQSVIVE